VRNGCARTPPNSAIRNWQSERSRISLRYSPKATEVRHIRHDMLVFRFEPCAWHHSLAGLWQSLGWRPSAEAQVAQSFAHSQVAGNDMGAEKRSRSSLWRRHSFSVCRPDYHHDVGSRVSVSAAGRASTGHCRIQQDTGGSCQRLSKFASGQTHKPPSNVAIALLEADACSASALGFRLGDIGREFVRSAVRESPFRVIEESGDG
jgi:hypothetical protein